jgi:hypothetical protein
MSAVVWDLAGGCVFTGAGMTGPSVDDSGLGVEVRVGVAELVDVARVELEVVDSVVEGGWIRTELD